MFQAYMHAHNSRRALLAAEEELPVFNSRWWKILLKLAVGVVGLPLGANRLVDGAVSIAQKAGIEEAVIGLTMVAIGTSLPELATTVMAAYRKEADVAIGNVIGSNIFNLLGVIGITSMTDSKGYTIYYKYDNFNRLIEVRDQDNHLVTDYEYHFKGQTN